MVRKAATIAISVKIRAKIVLQILTIWNPGFWELSFFEEVKFVLSKCLSNVDPSISYES